MKVKSISSLVPARISLLALALVCTAFPALISAQEINFQEAIDSTSKALIALDVKASDCLAALDSDEEVQSLCDDFINAIDGELMANYLAQCRTLKSWRDDYVNRTVTSDLDSDTESNEEYLRRLVSIEFTCGENTLRNRTQFVFTAFNRLRGGSTAGSRSTAELSQYISNGRFEALENGERQRLQNALRDQQSRSLRENERQFNALENELIRQRIQNSNPAN